MKNKVFEQLFSAISWEAMWMWLVRQLKYAWF